MTSKIFYHKETNKVLIKTDFCHFFGINRSSEIIKLELQECVSEDTSNDEDG